MTGYLRCFVRIVHTAYAKEFVFSFSIQNTDQHLFPHVTFLTFYKETFSERRSGEAYINLLSMNH